MFCVPPKKSREYAHIGEDGMIHIIEGTKDTVGLKSLQDNYRYKFLVQVYVIFEKVSVKGSEPKMWKEHVINTYGEVIRKRTTKLQKLKTQVM